MRLLLGETSSDESSSDDSSSDDEDKKWKKNKTDANEKATSNVKTNDVSDNDEDEDDTSCMDNVFSLSSLIGRVRSTHSPGGPNSNMSQHQPSPRNSEVYIEQLLTCKAPHLWLGIFSM